jgi:hypothetical protein
MVESPAVPDNQAHEVGHGNSIAAWSAVVIILIGTLIAALAVTFALVWLFIVGAVVIVLGAIAGKLLSAMGFGVSH